MDVPATAITIRQLGKEKKNGSVKHITLLGSKEKIKWKQLADALVREARLYSK
ncbi:hypothetical protein KRR40_38595 [Niabella defluvii]|nr:hypothetical protein KRR40_38595 [Niabella sp. I65]